MAIKGRPLQIQSPEPMRFGAAPSYLLLDSEKALREVLGVSGYSPAVDWSKSVVLLVQRGECPTGGYGVAITGLAVAGTTLQVTCRLTDPSPSSFVAMVVTYPQAAVAVDRKALRGVSGVVFAHPDGRVLGSVGVPV